MEQRKDKHSLFWLYTLKPIKQLKKFGNIHYISKLQDTSVYVAKDENRERHGTLIDISTLFVSGAIITTRTSYGFPRILPELH